jgi:hypothetical protein
LKVKEALRLRAIRVRPEDNFPCISRNTRKRVLANEERIIYAIEFNCLAKGRIDEVRMTKRCGWMSADRISPIKHPHLGLRTTRLAAPGLYRWQRAL